MATLSFRYARSIREIDERAWDALGPAHLCTRYAWLRALEESGSIGPERGIAFRIPLLLDAAGTIVAAAPGVNKGHTLGEHGPESEWIRRAQKSGKPLLPKLQIEVPMTPIAGPRLLTHPAWSRTELADALLKAILQATEAGQQNADPGAHDRRGGGTGPEARDGDQLRDRIGIAQRGLRELCRIPFPSEA